MPTSFREYFTPWVLVGAVLVACLTLSVTVLILIAIRPVQSSPAPGTASVYLIPAPSSTPPLPTPLPTATPFPTQSVISQGPVALGAYVQISGTGSDGLRLRSAPGLQGEIRFLAIEAEVFRVTDGPREIDSFTWWYLENPYQESIQGWAVSNYLAVIQNP